jgi:hypothetical protein
MRLGQEARPGVAFIWQAGTGCGFVDDSAAHLAARFRMLMSLQIRRTDSEVEMADGAVPQIPDSIERDRSSRKRLAAPAFP